MSTANDWRPISGWSNSISDFDPEAAQIGPQLAVAAVLADPHGLEHLDIAAGRRQRCNADLINGRDEGRRAAIHDRDFGPVDLDNRVVDAEPAQGRQDVLGCGYGRTARVTQHGGKFGSDHRAIIGAQLAIGLAIGAGAQEHDAGIGVGWVQRRGRGQP